jgi:phosphate transport system protein
MQRPFETDLDAIKQQLLTMAGLAEKSLGDVAKVLAAGDPDLARTVIDRDDRIDRCELEIDRLGTEFIVRHQPLAGDLRFVITAIKIAPRLERIGDNAVNIARYLLDIMDGPWTPPVAEVPRILALSRAMVAEVVEAFVTRDVRRAREVILRDDDVDRLYWGLFRTLLERMQAEPSRVHHLMSQVLVARFAERIGDQATNIAEEIIYLVEGEAVKHSPPQPRPAADPQRGKE